jgi:hypothetical protein
MVKPLPFMENGLTRIFSASVDETELQWHWDEEDRLVYPNHETSWRIQLDNQLPRELIVDDIIFIPAGVWHRLLKGSEDLSLQVIKCK